MILIMSSLEAMMHGHYCKGAYGNHEIRLDFSLIDNIHKNM